MASLHLGGPIFIQDVCVCVYVNGIARSVNNCLDFKTGLYDNVDFAIAFENEQMS